VTRVVVVGAGITGLTVAYRLATRPDPPDVTVLEASASPGGVIRSVRVGDLELEAGPDSFLVRKPWAVELCRDLGLGDDLVEQGATAAQILTPRGLLPVPAGRLGIAGSAGDVWRWKGVSVGDRLRAIAEPIVPRRRDEHDESVGSLARRRLGRGATEAIVAPLHGGLYAGDVDRLSVHATYPELATWEREDGSLRAGVRRAVAAPAALSEDGPTTPFATVRAGLHRIVQSLVTAIGPDRVRTGSPVRGLRRNGDRIALSTDAAPITADVVILTTSASLTAALLAELAPAAAPHLRGIPAASTAVALFVYPEGTDRLLPAASGFVARRGVLPITAATALSKKWPSPAFGSRAVIRAFVGGAGSEGELDRPDDQILRSSSKAVSEVYGLPAPDDQALVRWPDAMPQYLVGHLDRVASIRASLPAGVHVAGAAYGGVGIPDRVREANELAERVASADYPDGP
jgi:oxygen-dependent protoporphyrinogen oxidase